MAGSLLFRWFLQRLIEQVRDDDDLGEGEEWQQEGEL